MHQRAHMRTNCYDYSNFSLTEKTSKRGLFKVRCTRLYGLVPVSLGLYNNYILNQKGLTIIFAFFFSHYDGRIPVFDESGRKPNQFFLFSCDFTTRCSNSFASDVNQMHSGEHKRISLWAENSKECKFIILMLCN
jgi:hypothetical protein